MIARDGSITMSLVLLYGQERRDPGFVDVLRQVGPAELADVDLADLIEADGRYRLSRNLPVDLERYLTAVPDLPQRSDPLDAAIDMALRAVAKTGRAAPPAVEILIQSHPRLEGAIREAAALSDAIWSTTALRRQLSAPPPRAVPCGFGPLIPGAPQDGPRYELRELLGEGGFGQVYLAVDRHLSEPDHAALVSIKILTGHDRGAWARHRLIDEATKARRINHANVVRVIDRGVTDGNEDFIVYEYIDGGDLARWVRRRSTSLNVDEAVQLAAQVARGVHAAHMAGLVHCDLKPANIVVTADGEPKVADFGIATSPEQVGGPAGDDDPLGSTPMGNLAFMSPEQFNVEPGALTIPTDIYALGGILFWLITGNLPNGETPEEIARTQDRERGRREPPPLTRSGRGVDADLQGICHRALATDPALRHSSAAAFADDLEKWLKREPIAWRRPSTLRKLSLWTRRKPGVAAAVFVSAAVVLVSAFAVARFAARVDAEKRMKVEYNQKLRAYKDEIFSQGRSLEEDILSKLWIVEWMYGPTVLGLDLNRMDIWTVRRTVVSSLREDARANGKALTLEALVWESCLAMWQMNAGEYASAETMLAENLERWRGLLTRDDPFLDDLQAMLMCAYINRIAQDMTPDKMTDDVRQSLTTAAAVVDAAEHPLRYIRPEAPLRKLLVKTIGIAYGPTMLNRPDRLEDLRQAIPASTLKAR